MERGMVGEGSGGVRVREWLTASQAPKPPSPAPGVRPIRNIPVVRGRGGLLRTTLLEAVDLVSSSGRVPKCLALYWRAVLADSPAELGSAGAAHQLRSGTSIDGYEAKINAVSTLFQRCFNAVSTLFQRCSNAVLTLF